MAWGQEVVDRPEISLTFSKNHEEVHVEEKIIYVDPDKPRVLSIPVLNTNTKGSNTTNRSKYDNSYNWLFIGM